jgi:hypothetical protein
MKTFFLATLTGAVLAGSSAFAATFTPTFDTPPFPGTQYDVGAAENAFYETNYGITVENAYLYVDGRDTFDGIGIANGNVGEIGTSQAARINFLDTTDFVTVEYLSIRSGLYQAFDAANNLIDSFATPGGTTNGTDTLSGGIISYILFSGDGGYITVSGLTYNYDGTTDGRNDDIDDDTDPVPVVPLPAGAVLLLTGLGALVVSRRRSV